MSIPLSIVLILLLLLFGFGTISLIRDFLIGDQGEIVFWPSLIRVFTGTMGTLPW